MPRYRNLHHEELYLPHLDRSVKPDEVIDVQDDGRVWPDTLWAEVAVTKPKTTKGEE